MGPGAVTTSAVAGTEAALALAANEVFGYISTAHEELCDAGRRAKARVCMHACKHMFWYPSSVPVHDVQRLTDPPPWHTHKQPSTVLQCDTRYTQSPFRSIHKPAALCYSHVFHIQVDRGLADDAAVERFGSTTRSYQHPGHGGGFAGYWGDAWSNPWEAQGYRPWGGGGSGGRGGGGGGGGRYGGGGGGRRGGGGGGGRRGGGYGGAGAAPRHAGPPPFHGAAGARGGGGSTKWHDARGTSESEDDEYDYDDDVHHWRNKYGDFRSRF